MTRVSSFTEENNGQLPHVCQFCPFFSFYCYALNFIYRTTRKNHYSNHTVNERTYLATNE